MENTKIIFVGNYKGGVGKTTSVLNFAEYFSKYTNQTTSNKVLVLDIDPQSSLSEILVKNGTQKELNGLSAYETLNYIFDLNILKIEKYNSLKLHPWRNWIEHRPPKAGTARSNRAGCARIKKPMTLVVGVFVLHAFDDTNAQQSVRTAAKRWTCTPIVRQHNFARSAKPIRHGCARNLNRRLSAVLIYVIF